MGEAGLADPVGPSPSEASDDLLGALDAALAELEAVRPRASRVVECRFFGGMTIDETAAAVGTSPRSVKRDWTVAQAWLQRALASRDGVSGVPGGPPR